MSCNPSVSDSEKSYFNYPKSKPPKVSFSNNSSNKVVNDIHQ